MTTLVLSLTILLSSVTLGSYRANDYVFRIQEDVITKVEIKLNELPEKVIINITDTYHGAKILRAYKEYKDGKFIGYLAEIKKGPERWSPRYDQDGNPKNKIIPD